MISEEALEWAVLAAVPGVGPVTFGRLIAGLGSPGAVLLAAGRRDGLRRLLAAAAAVDDGRGGITADTARAIARAGADRNTLAAAIATASLEVLHLPHPRYPRRLRAIALPPPVLYVRGDVASLDAWHPTAIVGTRRPTEAGRSFAASVAEAIAARGSVVVSGLAFGVDAAAHRGAVRLGRPTVAVIGGGHGRLYPAGHRALADAIVGAGGAVASEHPPDTEPTRGTFPRRNRVISGLADATVVIEAGRTSGALTTAVWTLEEGRPLHVMPGRPGDPSVAGSLALLREGGPEAHAIAGIAELVEDLGLTRSETGGGRAASAGGAPEGLVEHRIAEAVAGGSETVDGLVAATGLAPATILAALTMLEVRGIVAATFGGYRLIGGASVRRRLHIPVVRRP